MTIFDGKTNIKGTPAQIIKQMRIKDGRSYYFNKTYMRAVSHRYAKWHGFKMPYTNSLTWLQAMAKGGHISIVNED